MFRADGFFFFQNILQQKVNLSGAYADFSLWKAWDFPSFWWKESRRALTWPVGSFCFK